MAKSDIFERDMPLGGRLGYRVEGSPIPFAKSFNPSFYLTVAFLLSAVLYSFLVVFRVHPFPLGDRRFFWVPSVFLVGALVVASASFGTTKFGGLREGAIEPTLSWLHHKIDVVRRDSYLVMLVAYVTLLLFAYFRFGVLLQFSLGMYALMTLPLILVVGRRRLVFIKSWIPFLVVILSYEALAGVVSVLVANGGIISLYAIDAPIWGFNLTGAVQSALLSPWLTTVMSFLYSLHLPLVVLASIYFWFSDRGVYRKYTYAIVITSYCALVTFLLFPTAPPWYEGAAANLLQGPNSFGQMQFYANLTNLIESDKFAAFPSLHCAYAIIFLFYMRMRGRRFGFIALPITMGILFSTVYLGQHYLIDLIGGAVYSLAACLLVDWLAKRSEVKAVGTAVSLPVDAPSLPLQVAFCPEKLGRQDGVSCSAPDRVV
jgi:membrane-associated phospholipid phosphatase